MNLIHLITQEWLSRPGRALLTALSVAIAVATLMGVLLAAKSSRSAYRSLSAELEGPPSLEILAKEGGRFEAASLDAKVKEIAGPKPLATLPMLFRGTIARIRGERAKRMVLGVDIDQLRKFPGFALSEGKFPEKPYEVLLDVEDAKRYGVEIGGRLSMLAGRGTTVRRVTLVVSGTFEAEKAAPFAEHSAIVVPLSSLQSWFLVKGEIDKVRLVFADDRQRQSAKRAWQKGLSEELVVQVAASRMQLAEEMLKSGEIALQFATALSLGMSALIILNTMRMNFTERRKQLAILRCLGCTQTQVSRLLLWEGGLFGLLGTCLGIPAGLVVARVMTLGMQELLDAPIPKVTFSWESLLIVCVVGPLVSLLAAWIPARQAFSVTPLEGLQEVEDYSSDKFPVTAGIVGLVIWLLSGAILWGVTYQAIAPEIAVGAGLLMLIAFVVWVPVFFTPMIWGLVAITPARFRFTVQMGAEQLLRRGTRTALTVGVLVVAVANSVGMGNAIQSNVADVRTWIAQTLSGDYLLAREQEPSSEIGYDPDEDPLRKQLLEMPEIKRVSLVHFIQVKADGLPAYCQAREIPTDGVLPLKLTGGGEPEAVRQEMLEGGAVLGSGLAQKLKKKAGDTIRVEVSGKALEMKCAGVASDYNFGGMTLVIPWDYAAKHLELGLPDYYVVDLKETASTTEAKLQGLADQSQMKLISVIEMRKMVNQSANAVVASLWALMGIGFVVGGFGIANTLMMSVLEQTRELGLLRIIGMTPSQILRLILLEALLLGTIGVVVGAIAGLIVAWVIHCINEPLLGHAVPFELGLGLLALNVGVGLLVVLMAAWVPGRRASKLKLLEAIACE